MVGTCISCFAVVYYFVSVSDNNGFGCSLLSLSIFILQVVCSSKQILLHVRAIGFLKGRGSNGVLTNPPPPKKEQKLKKNREGATKLINIILYVEFHP